MLNEASKKKKAKSWALLGIRCAILQHLYMYENKTTRIGGAFSCSVPRVDLKKPYIFIYKSWIVVLGGVFGVGKERAHMRFFTLFLHIICPHLLFYMYKLLLL